MIIGLLRETKIPADRRVALTPVQCRWIQKKYPNVKVYVQSCANRCFTDKEYLNAGIQVLDSVDECEVLLGIKEVKTETLLNKKTYLFFSHTKKKQPHNRTLLHTIINKKNTLIDFECFEHSDGQRIIGFGFFAGIVGAHNGMMVYGKRTGAFELQRVYKHKTFRQLMHTYFGLKIPNIKIAVTGSGRVAHGILEILNLLELREVEKEEYISKVFDYPVYVHLKGSDLYEHTKSGKYNREHFHDNPSEYKCRFNEYTPHTDILMNGVYWQQGVPRLFEEADVQNETFRIQVIADIADDPFGSVPINIGDQSIEDPVYGIDRRTLKKTDPYLFTSIDVMAVGNLPNELPRDASRYFGQQLIKYILPELMKPNSEIVEKATIVKEGSLTYEYDYLRDYAYNS
jgi:alanine dehydrogenase